MLVQTGGLAADRPIHVLHAASGKSVAIAVCVDPGLEQLILTPLMIALAERRIVHAINACLENAYALGNAGVSMPFSCASHQVSAASKPSGRAAR